MRAYRTGDHLPHDPGRANPYHELLAQGPPSTRPQLDDGPSPADGPTAPDGGPSPTGGPTAPHDAASPVRPAAPADGGPPAALLGGPGASVTGGTGHRPGSRDAVKVVLPGGLSPRRPATPAPPPATATPAVPSRPAGAGSDAVPRGPAERSTQPDRTRRPAPRRRFRRFYKSAAWLVFGLGIGGFFLAGVAIDRLGAWDHEVPLQKDTTLSFPRSEERWIWLPEERMGDIVCTGTDGGGANLPMRPALGYDHDDHSSAFRFPTGDGAVTLRCDATPSPATVGWAPSGAETVRVAEPVDRSRDVPFLQAALIVTLGGPALGVLMFVGTLVTQIGTGIAGLVKNVRRKRERRRRPSAQAGSR